jgi:hypothetical protein
VCLEESLYIHNIRDMKVLHTIRETPPNPAGEPLWGGLPPLHGATVKRINSSRAWWCTPVIPAPQRLKLDLEFQASLHYLVRPCVKISKETKAWVINQAAFPLGHGMLLMTK